MSTSDTALLDDIFESVTAAEAEDLFADVNPDGAANSCDDDDIDFSDPEDLFAVPPTTTPSTSASTSTSSALRPQPRPTPPAYRTTGSRSTPVSKPRAPLHPTPVNRPVSVGASAGRGGRLVYTVQKPDNGADSHYFIVQYRKPQQKKHKTWDGDAFIKVEGSRVTMMSDDGKHMATTALTGGLPGSGTELRIGNWDCEVDHAITYEEFKRSTSCLNNPANAPMQYSAPGPSRTPVSTKVAAARSTPFKGFKAPTMVSRPVGLATPVSRPASPAVKPSEEASSSSKGPIDAASFYAKPKPAPKKIVIGEKSSKEREAWGGALHDPNAEGAVVMPRPSELDAKRKGTAITDVVIDPLLSSKMREHQKKGVEFMYRCVMGMAGINGQGCILADEMGLGKTLQTIALIYTLCKQSPWQNESSVIGRALVVCPVSLVHNWKKEFRKWLPRDFGVVAIEDADESKVTAFTHHRGLHVLIIGYERLRKVIKRLASCQPPIGLIVCDEGHRLKSKDNKTTKMFDVLSTPRRIMLTGTPVQNDLGEYWAMAEFCNPGVLGTYSQFNRQFEKPITKAREPRCKDVDAALGQERMSELYDLTREFVIRRTADVLDKYLPPKTEYVVFVAPTTLQLNIFTQILGGGKGHALLSGQSKAQLATIHLLRKVANSPLLLRKKDDDEDYAAITSTIKEAQALLCPGESGIEQISGKMKVLDRILRSIADARGENEKIVVVSNWTSTLDLVQDLCIKRRYNFLRLDGSTPQKNRQEYVDRFNRGNRYDSMVFLLSAKAGGVGLNLIGASRLVLFDSDWNPSTDLQAMARIHRDGQKKPVYIYRLLTTNTIDEKIYQRQITKTGLSDQMMGGGGGGKGKESKDSFSFEELRDIFSVNLHTDGCQTHDLLGCDCEGKNDVRSSSEPETREPSREASPESSDEEKNLGFLPASQFNPEPTPKMRRKAEAAQQAKLAALKEWRHLDAFNTDSIRAVSDNLLYNLTREDYKTWDLKNDVAALKAETSMTASTSASSRSDTPEGPAAKKRKGLMEVMDAAMAEALNDSAANSQPEDSDDEVIVPSRRKRASQRINESPPEDSEEEAVVPSRHKRASTRLKEAEKNKLSSQMFIPAAVDRKHNVRTLAEQGQGGRIMYVFEKVSKSGFE